VPGLDAYASKVLVLGLVCHHAPNAQTLVQAIDNLEKLEQLTERLLTASSWQELRSDL
jgi:hypothetical protein